MRFSMLIPILALGLLSGRAHADPAAPVDPAVLAAASRGPAECLVVLAEQADLSLAATLPTKEDKGAFVFATLTALAERTQAPLIAELEQLGIPYRSYWLCNYLWVEADAATIERIATRPEVGRIVANPTGDVIRPFSSGKPSAPDQERNPVEWNIRKVRAPEVWEQGVTGEGVVVGSIDTGVDWDHPNLIRQYRGWDGTTATHDYNWWDGVPENRHGCPGDSPVPCDDSNHGTGTVGIMVGDDGMGNQTGMAPDAQWMACRCWEPELRTDVTYLTNCLQFMLAPTDLNGENPDPSRAPHVVNNSWICEPVEGCVDVDVLKPLFENLRAAGIHMVGAAGNDGPGCHTIWYPPAIYESYFTVGSVDSSGFPSLFSSRGDVDVDGSHRLKPDVSAYGEIIRMPDIGTGYQAGDGTSFACPQVAGLVALLISANPDLAGDLDRIESIIERTAVPRTYPQNCPGLPGDADPNYVSGHGIIDAFAAYQEVVPTAVLPEEPVVETGGFKLLGASPNPARAGTRIHYELGTASPVRIEVFDVAGRSVRKLVDLDRQPAGRHGVAWDGADDRGRPVAAGIYVVRVETEERVESERITVLR